MKKEPWQMIEKEFILWKRKLWNNLTGEEKEGWEEEPPCAGTPKSRVIEEWRDEHVAIVHRALSDGKPVPENVIAEHPEIREAPAAFECAAVTDDDGRLFDRYGPARYGCRLPGGTTGIGTTPSEALRDAYRNERLPQDPVKELLEAAVCIMMIIDHRDGLKFRQDLITEDERDHLRKAIARFDTKHSGKD